jgi:hypothetical protein
MQGWVISARDRDPHLHPTRKFARIGLGKARQADFPKNVHDMRLGLGTFYTSEA